MKVRITTTEEMLGMASGNPELHNEFIASKSADAEKAKEELEALSAEDLIEKSMTVFPRDTDGTPIMWDYQIKGFFKEHLGILMDFMEPDCKIGKAKLSRWTCKRIVDNAVFVTPRKIRLNFSGPVTTCTRPLRATTMKGDRVTLATSEALPAGVVMEFEVETLDPKLDELIVKCLDFGSKKGLGQWRNSGKGTFAWIKID